MSGLRGCAGGLGPWVKGRRVEVERVTLLPSGSFYCMSAVEVESWEVLILLPRGSEPLSSRCFIVRQFSFRDVSQIESMGS